LTDYGLAPINSDITFAAAATPGVVGISRWLAPELINPVCNGNIRPVMESKAGDVFSFAMLAVEVFTGAPPFEGRRPAKAALDLLGGCRPDMPGNAQAVGLTAEMWKLLGSCWQQDPEERPTMETVVRRWQKFVGNNNDDSLIPECVQVTLVNLTLSWLVLKFLRSA